MLVSHKKITCKAFLICMNFSFVIGMSELHSTIVGEYIELFFSVVGLFLFVLHFIPAAKFRWKSILKIIIFILIGLVAMKASGGATLLKLVLFCTITQDVEMKDVLDAYMWSLIIPLIFIASLSLIGVIDLYYIGGKNAIKFGMQNPNTVPVIVMAILVAFNLQNEWYLSKKTIVIELSISILLYLLCRARTAGIILVGYLVSIAVFKNVKSIHKIFKPIQYLFLIGAVISILIAILFGSRTMLWIQINSILSGRPLAWNLYLTKYGIDFWGQPIDLLIAALDNAYLRLLIQYGVLTFLVYFYMFLRISKHAFIYKKTVLLLSIVAYEVYFLMEFGPILINFCPVLMYESCLLLNRKRSN